MTKNKTTAEVINIIRDAKTEWMISRATGNPDIEHEKAQALVKALALLDSVQAGEEKMFPIQKYGKVPWRVAAKAYESYAALYGSQQSLERMAERGGFGVGEMDEFHPTWRDDVYGLKQPKPEVVTVVTVEELAGDMVNALHDYKLHGGKFGDTAARVIIGKMGSKFPNGLIIKGEKL